MPRSKRTVSHDIASERLSGMQDELQEVAQAEEVAVDEKEDKKLEDIRNLIFIGRKTLDVEVDGFVFTLQTLKNKENEFVVKQVLMLEDEERLLAVKNYTLAMAVRKINGYNLADVYNGDEDLNDFEKALEVLDELDSALVDFLFEKYTELKRELIGSFQPKEASNSVKK